MRTCIVGLILANMALVSSQPRGMGRGSLMVRGVRKLDEDKMNEGGMGQMAGKGDPKGILAAEDFMGNATNTTEAPGGNSTLEDLILMAEGDPIMAEEGDSVSEDEVESLSEDEASMDEVMSEDPDADMFE